MIDKKLYEIGEAVLHVMADNKEDFDKALRMTSEPEMEKAFNKLIVKAAIKTNSTNKFKVVEHMFYEILSQLGQ